MIRLDLAKVLDEAGPDGRRAARVRDILMTQPDYVPALTGLGALLAKRGRAGRRRETAAPLARAAARAGRRAIQSGAGARAAGPGTEAIAEYRRLARRLDGAGRQGCGANTPRRDGEVRVPVHARAGM